MKQKIIITLFLLAVCGCSSGNGITSVNPEEILSRTKITQTIHWQWDTGLYRVSPDHTSIEALPIRESGYHFNVNQFVEPPFSDCL